MVSRSATERPALIRTAIILRELFILTQDTSKRDEKWYLSVPSDSVSGVRLWKEMSC